MHSSQHVRFRNYSESYFYILKFLELVSSIKFWVLEILNSLEVEVFSLTLQIKNPNLI